MLEKLDSLSRIDLQLGISNRRDLNEILKKSQSRFERFGQGFSVIVGDIDSFKEINDQVGYDEGDCVLIKITETLKKGIREADLLGRWGEDEFLIVLPETPLEGATNVAETARKSTRLKILNYYFFNSLYKPARKDLIWCHKSGLSLRTASI